MTKKEIIKLLDKKIGLFDKTEDENSLGELYLSEVQFREAGGILKRLQILSKDQEEWNRKLKSIVEGNDRFCILNKDEILIDKKIINIPLPLLIIDSNCHFSNNIFNGRDMDFSLKKLGLSKK